MKNELPTIGNFAAAAVELLQGKWKVHILCAMSTGPVRLGQLVRLIPAASKKVLMADLKKLVSSGLVTREDLSDGEMVRHVEYDIAEPVKAHTLILLEQLEHWTKVCEAPGVVSPRNDISITNPLGLIKVGGQDIFPADTDEHPFTGIDPNR